MYTLASPAPAMTRRMTAFDGSCARSGNATLATAETTAPATMIRRDGIRSVSGSTTSTANELPARYAPTTHPSATDDADHSPRRSGTAAAGMFDGSRTSASVRPSNTPLIRLASPSARFRARPGCRDRHGTLDSRRRDVPSRDRPVRLVRQRRAHRPGARLRARDLRAVELDPSGGTSAAGAALVDARRAPRARDRDLRDGWHLDRGTLLHRGVVRPAGSGRGIRGVDAARATPRACGGDALERAPAHGRRGRRSAA